MNPAAVAPARESDDPALHAALDVVAREKRFLAATSAPAYEQSVAFYRTLAAGGWPHLVAWLGERVVGWADVAPTFGQSRAHIGLLGIALVPEARGHRIGAQLLGHAIERSWARGLTVGGAGARTLCGRPAGTLAPGAGQATGAWKRPSMLAPWL